MKSITYFNIICGLCAILLFIAVLYWPVEYYSILRIIIFIGALIVITNLSWKHIPWIIAFAVIAILFNPIVPIYLYNKAYWIPIDIISAILFLLIAFRKESHENQDQTLKKTNKTYSRDKIY